METTVYTTLCNALLPAVLSAGRLQVDYLRRGVSVETKADRTPVTLADRESEAIILASLAAAAPGIAVVAEEAMAGGDKPVIGDRFFLVDPLDGTREFIAGRREFTINIALVENRQPVFGLIYAPATGQFFANMGAELAVEADVDASRAITSLAEIATRRMQSRAPPAAGLVAIASRSHMTEATGRYLDRFVLQDSRSAGSSLKFCLIARGDADIYPRIGGRTCEWDIAAGHAILAAAGGVVVQPDGTAMRYGKTKAGFVNSDYVALGRAAIMDLRR